MAGALRSMAPNCLQHIRAASASCGEFQLQVSWRPTFQFPWQTVLPSSAAPCHGMEEPFGAGPTKGKEMYSPWIAVLDLRPLGSPPPPSLANPASVLRGVAIWTV